MLSLQEMREKQNALNAKASSTGNTTGQAVFNFKDLKQGDSVRIRFVEDSDKNDVFWREKKFRILQFPSVIDNTGELINQTAYVEIPAFNTKYKEEMISNPPVEYIYKSDEDVIQNKIRGFWDDTEAGRKLYNKFGRKKSYIFRGFLESDVQGYERNKLYRFYINEELFKLISSFLTNEEIETVPVDKERGLDFVINVTSKQVSKDGVTTNFPEYSTSTYARRETALNPEELKYLSENDLPPLLTYIPKRPSAEEEKVMEEMFEACVNGEAYDVRKWGNVFKPNNIQFDSDGRIKADAGKVSTLTPKYTYSAPQVAPVKEVEQPVVSQVSEPEQSPVRVTNLINEHSETVQTQDPKELISGIMSKYKMQ